MRKGFFSVSDLKTRAPRLMSLPGCGACGLHKTCISPKMKPMGQGEKKILYISDAPGAAEDKKGVQLAGQAGRLVRQVLKKDNINFDRDCLRINAINCRPPNDDYDAVQIEYCRPSVLKVIKEFQPKLIITVGSAAFRSIVGHRYPGKVGKLMKWRGHAIPDRDYGCWIVPTYHPNHVIKMDHNAAVQLLFDNDHRMAIEALNHPLPSYHHREKDFVEILWTDREAIRYMSHIMREPTMIAFDYETTGLKPHARGHQIVSCAISTGPEHAVAFMVTPRIMPTMAKMLKDPRIKKVAANMKFEDSWSRVHLDTKVYGWVWDTMVCQHVLDNRSASTSLKFQAYVRYGIIDYDSHISPYLASKETNNANAFNQIHKIDHTDLLVYNGIDSMLEYRLACDQMKAMGIIDPLHYAMTGARPKNDSNEWQSRSI